MRITEGSMNRFEAQIEVGATGLVLHLVGNASAMDAAVLDRKVREVIVLRPKRVVVDLGEVEFISSTAISLLAHMHRELSGDGGQVVLANAPAQIAEVIERCRISDLLPLVHSVEAALQ